MNVNARAKGGRVVEGILKRQMRIALWKQKGGWDEERDLEGKDSRAGQRRQRYKVKK